MLMSTFARQLSMLPGMNMGVILSTLMPAAMIGTLHICPSYAKYLRVGEWKVPTVCR